MLKKARKWISNRVDTYKKAWDLAIAKVAYENGNHEKALPVFEKYAEQELCIAQFDLGEMYANGYCVEKDIVRAFQLYEKAALQDYTTAQMACGACCFEGKGTAEDHAKALYWFEKVAEQGVACAQDLCGNMYYEGVGVAQDIKKALFWSEKAALQGEVDSQLRCARIYSGDSYTNLTKAEEWLYKAVMSGEELDPLVLCAVHFELFAGWAEKVEQTAGREDVAELKEAARELVATWRGTSENPSL